MHLKGAREAALDAQNRAALIAASPCEVDAGGRTDALLVQLVGGLEAVDKLLIGLCTHGTQATSQGSAQQRLAWLGMSFVQSRWPTGQRQLPRGACCRLQPASIVVVLVSVFALLTLRQGPMPNSLMRLPSVFHNGLSRNRCLMRLSWHTPRSRHVEGQPHGQDTDLGSRSFMAIGCLIIIISSKACNTRVMSVLLRCCRCSYLCN